MKLVPKKTLLKIKPYVPGKPIEEVKREFGLKDVIKLASNENPYPPSKKVLKAIETAAKNANRYPASDCYYIRTEIAKRLKIKPAQVVFGNGSDELIVLAVRAFVNKGDEVIIAKPSFLVYNLASSIVGAKIKAIPLKNLRYDLKAMKKAVTKRTKLIFLGNPDNPSGMYLTKKEISEFLKGLRKDILVFFDEAYFEYVDEKDYVDTLSLIKSNKNIIVTRTFSKIYGLAGLRIGYGIADEKIIDIFNMIREPFNVNSVAQAAALACLRDKVYYKNILKKVKEQREYLYDCLGKMGFDFTRTYTNFILIKVNERSSDVCLKLIKKGVIVRDMKSWGINNYIRATIGTEKENKRLVSALKKVLR